MATEPLEHALHIPGTPDTRNVILAGVWKMGRGLFDSAPGSVAAPHAVGRDRSS